MCFIVVHRDPRDIALSIYKNHFRLGTHRYANDLAEIAEGIQGMLPTDPRLTPALILGLNAGLAAYFLPPPCVLLLLLIYTGIYLWFYCTHDFLFRVVQDASVYGIRWCFLCFVFCMHVARL